LRPRQRPEGHASITVVEHDQHGAVRPVRPHPADLHAGDGDRGARRRARHGQALDVGRRGDADVVLVHDRAAEERFVADGFGGPRRPVMFNDFILLGPATDPAGIGGLRDSVEALRRIAAARSPFISRGDRSGTHAAELRLWQEAGIDPATGRGAWYREVGQGMGPALNTAAAQGAYILADRGTWLSFRNRQDLRIVTEGDERLANQYGVMLVSPRRHAHVKAEAGQRFIDWLTSPPDRRRSRATASAASSSSSPTRTSPAPDAD
jgi:tungstate transport system substrate-binding protein